MECTVLRLDLRLVMLVKSKCVSYVGRCPHTNSIWSSKGQIRSAIAPEPSTANKNDLPTSASPQLRFLRRHHVVPEDTFSWWCNNDTALLLATS